MLIALDTEGFFDSRNVFPHLNSTINIFQNHLPLIFRFR